MRKPHRLDALCLRHGIRHKLTQALHPWTNGLVERQNRRIKDATVNRTRYASRETMIADLLSFTQSYNLKPHGAPRASPWGSISRLYSTYLQNFTDHRISGMFYDFSNS